MTLRPSSVREFPTRRSPRFVRAPDFPRTKPNKGLLLSAHDAAAEKEGGGELAYMKYLRGRGSGGKGALQGQIEKTIWWIKSKLCFLLFLVIHRKEKGTKLKRKVESFSLPLFTVAFNSIYSYMPPITTSQVSILHYVTKITAACKSPP